MQISLPANLERSILVEIENGHFASVDDAIAEAVRLLLRRTSAGVEPGPTVAGDPEASDPRPIWEVFEEITASIPAEEWSKLPTDGAEQHDHYIYGTPKRPTS